MPEYWASSSHSVEGDIAELGSSFTMLEAISNNPQGEGLHLSFCLDLGGPICEHTWKFWNLGDPATILFVLELNLESHDVCFQRLSVLRRPVRPALPVEHPASSAGRASTTGLGERMATPSCPVWCKPLFGGTVHHEAPPSGNGRSLIQPAAAEALERVIPAPSPPWRARSGPTILEATHEGRSTSPSAHQSIR